MNNNRFLQVKDRAHRRVRGLWKRNGTFYVQTTVQDTDTGLKKVTRISLPHATDIDSAKSAAAILKQKIAEGETVHGKQGPTFSAYREHYIKTVMGKKPKTITCEKSFLKKWEKFFKPDKKIGSITKQNVLAFRVKLEADEYCARTINLHVITLRNLFKMAKNENYIKTLPTDGVTQLKIVHKERRLLTIAEIDLVCETALKKHKRNGQQFADFIRLLAYCGGRTSEVLQLTWADVDFRQKVIVFKGATTKNSQTRRVDFNPQLENHLKSMHAKKTAAALFPSCRTDNAVTSFKTMLSQVRKELDMPFFTNHLLRHYYTSTAVMAGIDYMTIASWIGHKDGGVLIGKTYGHLNREHTMKMAQKMIF